MKLVFTTDIATAIDTRSTTAAAWGQGRRSLALNHWAAVGTHGGFSLHGTARKRSLLKNRSANSNTTNRLRLIGVGSLSALGFIVTK